LFRRDEDFISRVGNTSQLSICLLVMGETTGAPQP